MHKILTYLRVPNELKHWHSTAQEPELEMQFGCRLEEVNKFINQVCVNKTPQGNQTLPSIYTENVQKVQIVIRESSKIDLLYQLGEYLWGFQSSKVSVEF